MKMTLNHKYSNIYLRMKVYPLTRISSPVPENLPKYTPYGGCLLHRKSIPVPP